MKKLPESQILTVQNAQMNDSDASSLWRVTTRWNFLFWAIVIIFGLILCWHRRFGINPDGVSYIDIGDAYFRSDWSHAINAYWSPLYSWIIGFVLFLCRPSAYWEIAVIKLVNFIIYLAAWWATLFLLRAVLERPSLAKAQGGHEQLHVLPVCLSYATTLTLFLFIMRNWIPISLVGADLCVYTLLCIGAVLLYRITSDLASAGTFALLGVVLGFGYLAKAVMFPIALVFLILGWLFAIFRKKYVLNMLLATTVFLMVALPFITAISLQKGRITIGDTSWVQMLYLERIMAPKGSPEEMAKSIEAPPRLRYPLDTPYFQEFATPINATYPKHYDPSYWWEGAKIHFSPRTHLKAIMTATSVYQEMFQQLGFIMVIVIIAMAVSNPPLLKNLLRYWAILLVACAGLGLYWLLYVNERYVAGFVMLLICSCLGAIRLPAGPISMRFDKAAALAVVACFLIGYGPRYIYEAGHSIFDLASNCPKHSHDQWVIATQLRKLGLAAGDRVGVVFYGSDAYWARLAKLKIVSELSVVGEPPDFSTIRKLLPGCFTSEGALRPEVLEGFSKTGAKAIIAQDVPSPECDHGWVRLGQTSYFAFLLNK